MIKELNDIMEQIETLADIPDETLGKEVCHLHDVQLILNSVIVSVNNG